MRTTTPKGRNFLENEAVVGNAEKSGKIVNFFSDDSFAIVQVPAEHRLFEVFSLLKWSVMVGDLSFETVIQERQAGCRDTDGGNNIEGVFLTEIKMFFTIDKALLGCLVNTTNPFQGFFNPVGFFSDHIFN